MKATLTIAALVAICAAAPNAPTAQAAPQLKPPIVIQSDDTDAYHQETEGLNPELRRQAELVLLEGDGRIRVSGGVGGLGGRRTPEQQQKLINDYANGVPGAAPADSVEESEHVTGDAVDFEVHGDDNVRLRAELTAKHGLCMTHKNEPWHYELCTGD